jgi:hypothetical protein
MKRQNKYQYLKVLQEWNGEQWCDSAACDAQDLKSLRELVDDKKTYIAEGIPAKIISRRMLATEKFHA